MSGLRGSYAPPFAALRVYNYRCYFIGQSISFSGTWAQFVALGLLILKLGGSPFTLGLLPAAQYLPTLLLGQVGGLLTDRIEHRRRLIVIDQLLQAGLAAALGALTLEHAITIPLIFLIAVGSGLVTAVDTAARSAFVEQMVGRARIPNAVTLNNVISNGARTVGPALAALLVSTVGLGACFVLNAASYAALVAALAVMRRGEIFELPPRAPRKAALLDGLHYVSSRVELAAPLVLMAMIGVFAWNFQVSLPLMAKDAFHDGQSAYGLMMATMGVGSVAGGVLVAMVARPSGRRLAFVAAVFGVLVTGCALMPTFSLDLPALAVMGFVSIAVTSMVSSLLQLRSEPRVRGQVMAFYSMAFLGSYPLGGPITGALASAFGPRACLAVGGVVSVGIAAVLFRALVRGDAIASGALSPVGRQATGDLPVVSTPLAGAGALALAGDAGALAEKSGGRELLGGTDGWKPIDGGRN